MINKIKTALSIILVILMCVMFGTDIIVNCQKAVLMNELSQAINNQENIIDELEDVVATLEQRE